MALSSNRVAPPGRYVLITGASSGLGRETAVHLAKRGFNVLAGVRTQEAFESLTLAAAPGRIDPILLEITDDRSIAAAVAQVSNRLGDQGLWGLVNNAGICISAPLELVPSDLLRRQLEVNVIGQLAVTRAFLPMLRQSGGGRLVNVTSGLGTVAIPYLGAYAAAQFAKEGASDALRRELAPWGIAVSVVSPGAIWTPIWGKIAEEGARVLAAAPARVANLYRETYQRFLDANEQTARNSRTTPADVATAIHSALISNKPKTRYRVGTDVRRGALLAWLLPDTMVDGLFKPIVTATSVRKEVQHVRS